MIYALADCHLSCHSSTNKSMEILVQPGLIMPKELEIFVRPISEKMMFSSYRGIFHGPCI